MAKHFLSVVCFLFVAYHVFGDTIVLNGYEQIGDVKVKSILTDTIFYEENGELKHIEKKAVTGILYDSGNYQEIVHNSNIFPDDPIMNQMQQLAEDTIRKYSSFNWKPAKSEKKSSKRTSEPPASESPENNQSDERGSQGSAYVQPETSASTSKTETKPSSPAMIPQKCMAEGNAEYQRVFAEEKANAIRKGYSKWQAHTLASDLAFKAKQKVIAECTQKVQEEP